MMELRSSAPTDAVVKVQFLVSQYAGCPLGSLRRVDELNPDCTKSPLDEVLGFAPLHAPAFLPKPIPRFGDLHSGLGGMSTCQVPNFPLDGLSQILLEFSSIEFEPENHAALAVMSWIRKVYVCREEESPPISATSR
jgi:hypothetical protein